MIAVDTNILVYAHRAEYHQHGAARSRLTALAESDSPWALPASVIGSFLRLVTDGRIHRPPTATRVALDAVDRLLASPSLRILRPGGQFFGLLREEIESSRAVGPLIADAEIVATCREYGVTSILSEDRDFLRFPAVSLETLSGEGQG